MASEICKACGAGRNCINGRYCHRLGRYVEHDKIDECRWQREEDPEKS